MNKTTFDPVDFSEFTELDNEDNYQNNYQNNLECKLYDEVYSNIDNLLTNPNIKNSLIPSNNNYTKKLVEVDKMEEKEALVFSLYSMFMIFLFINNK